MKLNTKQWDVFPRCLQTCSFFYSAIGGAGYRHNHRQLLLPMPSHQVRSIAALAPENARMIILQAACSIGRCKAADIA